VFRKQKSTIHEEPILPNFHRAKVIILKPDATGVVFVGLFNWYVLFGVLRPVNFCSQKCSPEEQNYDAYGQEWLGIVETVNLGRQHLEGANDKIFIRWDQKTLDYLHTPRVVSGRQARWSEILSAYDFVINHLEGRKNAAHGPSRWPDYEFGYKRPVAQQWATVSVEPYDNFMPGIIAAQPFNAQTVEVLAKLVYRPVIDGTDTGKEDTGWTGMIGDVTYEGRIYVPAIDCLWRTVLSLFHDNPELGHFGALKTTEGVSGDIYWPFTDSCVHKYVS